MSATAHRVPWQRHRGPAGRNASRAPSRPGPSCQRWDCPGRGRARCGRGTRHRCRGRDRHTPTPTRLSDSDVPARTVSRAPSAGRSSRPGDGHQRRRAASRRPRTRTRDTAARAPRSSPCHPVRSSPGQAMCWLLTAPDGAGSRADLPTPIGFPSAQQAGLPSAVEGGRHREGGRMWRRTVFRTT